MRRSLAGAGLLSLTVLLSGCSAIGDKSASPTMIYGATVLLSLVLLVAYCILSRKREPWFLLLFTSVLVVNVGYLFLAMSRDLDEALLANRLAYLGSVFLPLAMGMIIVNVTRIQTKKWIPGALLFLGFAVFLVAASPGYLDIYYKEVTFSRINGMTVLEKVYGPAHILYLLYLLGWFAGMVATIFYAAFRKKLDSPAYAAVLLMAVFVNIGVWLIEQLVRIDFEILSVSYIISECFLLGLRAFQAEKQQRKSAEPTPEPAVLTAPAPSEPVAAEQLELYEKGLQSLTPKERAIYDSYIQGLSTAQIMEQLNIKENTLKFHNRNLYSKLGVSSRKELLAIARNKKT